MIYLVTVKPGKEDKCGMDILDAIFPYDSTVEYKKCEKKGNIILESRLTWRNLFKILSRKRIRHLYGIIPFLKVFNKFNVFLDSLLLDLSNLEEIYLELRMDKASKNLEEVIKKRIKARGIRIISKRKSKKVVMVGILGKIIGYSILDKDEFYKLRRSIISPF